jgi:hypothetical protein
MILVNFLGEPVKVKDQLSNDLKFYLKNKMYLSIIFYKIKITSI